MDIYAPNPLGFSGKNLVINGNLLVNQRAYASGSALAANAHGHDRWGDATGSAGTAYTFTQGIVDTTITLTAGQIQQALEPGVYPGGPCVLSWVGTVALTLFYLVPGASYYTQIGPTASPLVAPSIPQGSAIIVRTSGLGTLGLVQLEIGTSPTPFERRPFAIEQALCQRYFEVASGSLRGAVDSSGSIGAYVGFKVTKRATPTVAYVSDGNTSNIGKFQGMIFIDASSVGLQFIGLTAGALYYNYGFIVQASADT